jgi:SRSO17 transposase
VSSFIDAGYGVEAKFRSEISALKLKYVAGVKTTNTVWAPDTFASAENSRRGRNEGTPISVEKLALTLPKSSWRAIRWRDGTNDVLSSRFARVRVRSARDRDAAKETVPEEWLLIEWPPDETAPTKFWFSTLGPNVTFAHLVRTAKLRWRIERDYLELKQEIGLDHFEGRGWRGFHHHATLCIAAYAFLVAERAAFPPHKRVAALLSKCLPFPKITGRGALPIRTQRHIPDSIATIRYEIAAYLAAHLERCPCCAQPRSNRKNR